MINERIYIKILNVVVAFLLIMNQSYGDSKGAIINSDVVADTLNLGICLPGDKLESSFLLRNTGNKSLKIRKTQPSFSIERLGVPGHDNDHEEFYDNMPTDSITISPGDSAELTIGYQASNDTNIYTYGPKIVRLLLGLYESGKDVPPTDTSQYAAFRSIIALAGKVRNHISGHTEIINFDSVYISQETNVSLNWRVFNVSDQNIKIDSQKIDWLSPKLFDEYEIKGTIPLQMPKKSGPVNWVINYQPEDELGDSIVFALGYKFEDNQKFSGVKIKGIGVRQNLIITGTNARGFNGDTLDIGKIPVGSVKEVNAVVANSGNMNFGASGQNIFDGMDGELISDRYSLIREIRESSHIIPTHGDTFGISFNPDRIGIFYARYAIESDIDKRPQIKGVPQSARTKIFYLKGEGVAPVFRPEKDTIDFGNVIWHEECQTSKSFILRFKNRGNADLQIFAIEYQDPFKVEYYTNTPPWILAPFAEDSVDVIFSPNIQNDYSSEIIFITNDVSGFNPVKVYIKASRVDPDSIELSIDNGLRIKPGNIISAPLVIESDKINKARTFSTDLTYNKSLMRYAGFQKLGTACENTDDSDFDIREETNGGGRLRVKFHTPASGVYFLERDTLIRIFFRSYIGDNLTTAISIIDPLFGDGVCDKILLPKTNNGVLTIDSICGLSNLLLPNGGGNFFIGEFFPNPTMERSSIQFELKYETALEIGLYNELGIAVKNIYSGVKVPGLYEIEVDCSDLGSGLYFIRFSSGLLSTSRKISITKQ